MDSNQRESLIINYLEKNLRVSMIELCELCNTASSTMRKQLAEMERKGLIIRTHGGAVSIDKGQGDSITEKKLRNIYEKQLIAQKAAEFIKDGDTIVLGSGTTIYELCTCLNHLQHAIIYTNSLLVANSLSKNKNLEIHICSGIIKGHTGTVVGYEANEYFRSIKVNKTFVTPDAISADGVLYSANISVAQVESQMLKCANESYILCDTTKLNRTSLVPFGNLSEVTGLVTNYSSNVSKFENLYGHIKLITAY